MMKVALSGKVIACMLPWEKEGSHMIFPPNGMQFSATGYAPSDLEVQAKLDLDEEGVIANLTVLSVSILVKSMSQAKFTPTIGQHCEKLPASNYEFSFTY